MGIISKPYATADGTTAVGANVSSNFDTIYAEFNGNIDNNNIKANAGIVDTKLATITTAGKVSTSALTGTFPNNTFAYLTATNLLATNIKTTTLTATTISCTTVNATTFNATTVSSSNYNGVFLGTWSDAYARTTSYLAGSDGFVSAYNTTGEVISIFTDSSNPPTTCRVKNSMDEHNEPAGVTCPVRRGDYWMVVGPTASAIFWIPIGA